MTSKSCGKSRASSYIAPVPSSGFRGLAKSGMKLFIVSTEAADSGGSSTPARSAASDARPHSPPSPLRIPTRQRRGADRRAAGRSASVSIISLRLETCTTPLCLSIASTISAVPASEPVWASIAWRAFSERPTFSTTMGLPSARARAAACRNVSGFLKPSTKAPTTWVSSSATR